VAKPDAGSRAASAASLARAWQAADAAEAKQAADVVVLDLRGQTLVTDYFVICTGTSRVQIRAITNGILESMREASPRVLREGDEDAQWVLLDYGDVVVHVFGPEARAFYRLERLWGDARVLARG
jgi:ribosome-associated protein